MAIHVNRFDPVLQVIGAISTAGLLVVVAMTVVTMWAAGRSMERAACYRTATAVEQCGAPSQIERLLAAVIGPKLH